MPVRTFPARPDQVGEARAFTREALAGHPRAHDATLAISEMATNAIEHTRAGEFEVTIRVDGPRVRIDVSDAGSQTRPHVAARGADDPTGRGMMIVAALADRWGHQEANGAGVATTWVEISAPLAPARRLPPHGG